MIRDASHRIRVDGFHFYRGDEKWLVKGVTYGPFQPSDETDHYPPCDVLDADFRNIADTGINVVRLYNLPPPRVRACAEKHDLYLLVDIPWPKHLDVYEDPALRSLCFDLLEKSVTVLKEWDCCLGIILGNEIPADVVRWRGARQVEDFLREMYQRAKHSAPHLLVGFANFPSTEYLELDFLDFVGFNIYLQDPATLQDYLVRLRHLYPDKPVILTECGLDSQEAGLHMQAKNLPQYLRIAFEAGLAGILIFSWTDKWFTGGKEIMEWDFGMVDRARQPKPALSVVAETYAEAPQCRAGIDIPASIVIATYNGGRTLRQCLESIQKLRYPNFETIVVDDGSTDDTAQILRDFDWVKVVSQKNHGLSAARNAGIKAASGDIIAFTDSDCIVDEDWLYFVALFLVDNSQMAGVGGPNITPCENTLTHRAIGQAPGHATHVLITHKEAEHVPGCNMAFWKSALQAIGGFNPIYHKAGDDVDVIWRLQDAGYTVGFSTAAFVWHHRRPTVSGYIKQQAGYGEAESLLLRNHPQRFTETGQSAWRGIIYPTHSMRGGGGNRSIQYGVFGTAGYQCIYFGRPAMWIYYVASLEWWGMTVMLLLAGLIAPAAFWVGIATLVLSLAVSAKVAWTNRPSSLDYPVQTFPLVWMLHVIQPIVRSASRYWYRVKSLPIGNEPRNAKPTPPVEKHDVAVMTYWSEKPGLWRSHVIDEIAKEMQARQMIVYPNNSWENWDLSIILSAWFRIRITSMEECLGDHRRHLKFRFRLVPTSLLYIFLIVVLTACFLVALYHSIYARWILTACLLFLLWVYRMVLKSRIEVIELVEEVVTREGYWPVVDDESSTEETTKTTTLDDLSVEGDRP